MSQKTSLQSLITETFVRLTEAEKDLTRRENLVVEREGYLRLAEAEQDKRLQARIDAATAGLRAEVRRMKEAVTASDKVVAERDAKIVKLNNLLVERAAEIEELKQELKDVLAEELLPANGAGCGTLK